MNDSHQDTTGITDVLEVVALAAPLQKCVGGASTGLCNDNHRDIDISCAHAPTWQHIKWSCWKMDTVCRPGQGCQGENETTFGQDFDGGNYRSVQYVCFDYGSLRGPGYREGS
ncbi:hypothetical protein B0T11DRAFT_294852 [Plectosphaerella cucumerina]|uniref:Uncharacterized protein n=1 Tax=Plectosphaerella cucumerina TaxID=40658 RepID=A0A8K0TLZ4_9PEZI|nr:hypothetical protein B0T11DRAFT_294852 [Plectosphaerella cucumerina]